MLGSSRNEKSRSSVGESETSVGSCCSIGSTFDGAASLEGDLVGDMGDLIAELAREEAGDKGSSASSSGPLVVLRGSAARLEGFLECVAMVDDQAGDCALVTD